MNLNKVEKIAKKIKDPDTMGSYTNDECIFLLKNLNGLIDEEGNEEREGNMSSGIHYSEMLPIEYEPEQNYVDLFLSSLGGYSNSIAVYIATISELIVKDKDKPILVSLARAGTPVGVLVKEYIKEKYGTNLPHYSISIIRGKGIDENALLYILNKHKDDNIQFIDGWTGKGAISKELNNSINKFNNEYGTDIKSDIAVISDPSNVASIFGTKKDILIPSSFLNSTVSGLVSRTVDRVDLINKNDFHGAKYYENWKKKDLSSFFVTEITKHFPEIICNLNLDELKTSKPEKNTGIIEVHKIQEIYKIEDINKIKPGIGETTRVLLRRVPWKILVGDCDNKDVEHILLLAKQKNVEVEIYKNDNYSCFGLIK